MSLQFIMGKAGYDHFSAIINMLENDYIMDNYRNNHTKKTIPRYYFYLVPNHIKFRSEINTLKKLRADGSKKHNDNSGYAQINVQILSLTRMGWFFFNKCIMPQHQQIDDSGVNMLLYMIIKEHTKDLLAFDHEVNQPGFVLKIAQEISEMQTSQLSADSLEHLYNKYTENTNQNDQNDELVRKMHDFIIIYKAYEKETNNKYISKSGVLDQLCDVLSDSKWNKYLSKCRFYISGFSQFTAQELRLIQILMKESASVVIDLDIDSSCINGKSKNLHPYDLFYRPFILYKRLRKIAKDAKVSVKSSEKLDKDKSTKKYRVSSGISKLESYWIKAYQDHIRPNEFKDLLNNSKSIQVIQSDNTYSELSNVATKIRQLVLTKKYRYSDFLILTRHLDKFSNVIKSIFHLQQIPIFNDLQKQMVLHPLVRLIGDLFSIYHSKSKHKYTYRDIMDLFKLGLLIPKIDKDHYMDVKDYYHDLYLCENCALKNGYWSDEWVQKKPWTYYTRYDLNHKKTNKVDVNRDINKYVTNVNERINKIKKFIRKTLVPFFDELDKAKSCKDVAIDLYNFLVNHGVVNQLSLWRQEEIKNNQLEYAGQNNQVWNVFCKLLDSCVDVLGDKELNDNFTINDFWSLLKAGFESASYSQVPPTFDQVVISESKIVQMRDYKVVFMIGSTDDVMPDHTSNDTLFSNTDRTDLKPFIKTFNKHSDVQCYLNDGSEYQANNEPYLNYLAFMSATQEVIFTYSLKSDDEDSGGIDESPYIKHMQNAFDIHVQYPKMKPSLEPLTNNRYKLSSVKSYLGSALGTLHHLVQAQYIIANLNKRSNKKNHNKKDTVTLPNDWKYVKSLLLKKHGTRLYDLTQRLLQSVDYKNEPKELTPKHADELYGNRLDMSITQLETFYKNPYEYFLKYGLKLKPRQILGNTISSNFGQFYHEALEHVLISIKHNNQAFTDFSKGHLFEDVNKVVNDLVNKDSSDKYHILRSSARMEYIKQRLSNTVQAMIYTIYLQAHHTKLRPLYMELPFKSNTNKLNRLDKRLDPLQFTVYPQFKDKKTNQYKTKPHQLLVNGRIDRLDYLPLQNGNRKYYGIVDYKSSPHSLDYGQIFAGTQMQMMTYLDALYSYLQSKNKNNKKDNVDVRNYVFGALYSLIQKPLLRPKDIKQFAKLNKYRKDPWKILLQHQQYNGILIDDIGLPISSLDDSLNKTSTSSIMYKSLRTKTTGHLTQRSKNYFITPNDFNIIRKWIEHKIVKAGASIYEGKDELRPAKWGSNKNQNALAYSDYEPIMCFDPILNKYHKIKSINTPNDLIQDIKHTEDGKDK